MKRIDFNKMGPTLAVGAALGVAAAVTFAGIGAAKPACPRVGCHPVERSATALTIPAAPLPSQPATVAAPAPASSPVRGTTPRRSTSSTPTPTSGVGSPSQPSSGSNEAPPVVGSHSDQPGSGLPEPTTTTTVPQLTVPTITLFPSP